MNDNLPIPPLVPLPIDVRQNRLGFDKAGLIKHEAPRRSRGGPSSTITAPDSP
ncbi:hypothetical protein [Streptomyces sp. MST-110588]|uniref:hypothetical protein n=1 Tax=Streptomyces sp. MST-110588 TaxID=2833628 RepID=UPI001F5DD811|nr:hypothetical protein [Streptomyces sp. MST-110588]UNO43268.1 hypothetical protein KGS77_32000 [Streptomyces sp. MST-110588]